MRSGAPDPSLHTSRTEPLLDPERNLQQSFVGVPARDQLNPNRQPVGAATGWQGQAWHMELGPHRVENGRPGTGKPTRGLTGRRQGEDRVEARGPLPCRAPRHLGTAAGRAETLEG